MGRPAGGCSGFTAVSLASWRARPLNGAVLLVGCGSETRQHELFTREGTNNYSF